MTDLHSRVIKPHLYKTGGLWACGLGRFPGFSFLGVTPVDAFLYLAISAQGRSYFSERRKKKGQK